MSKQRSVKAEFGVLEISKDNILVDYIEKPETRSYVSTGINVLSKDCKQYIKKDESIGMPDLMLRMRDAGKTISCYKTTAKWLDLGRFDDLEAAQDEFERNRKKFLHLK